MSRKLTYGYVKKVFEDGGCQLIGEYISYDFKVKYRCNCGDIAEIFLGNFKKGQRCRKCGTIRMIKAKTPSINEVKKIFREGGCKLLSDTYFSGKKLKYKCNCGNISKILLNNFKKGERCQKCGNKRIGYAQKHLFSYIKSFFENKGCQLLSKCYLNNSTKMDYVCNCGNVSKISFNEFRSGHRCKKCGIEKLSGMNSVHYNYDKTDEERINERKYFRYNEWRKNVYTKDNYICQKCSQRGGKINAHHIENYSSNKKLRLKISNGITLCRKCHSEFHNKYGKKKNNRYQLQEFLQIEAVCLK